MLRLTSETLEIKGHYNEALAVKQRSIEYTREIYGSDLSEILANNKVRKIEEQDEVNLFLAEEKTKNYGYLLVAAGTIILLIIMIIIFQLRKNLKLSKKNDIIKSQRDEISQRNNEKQLLLKEIHHRVKNNFQIVSSLMELQLNGVKDKEVLTLVREGQSRIRSMAMIHQKLYQNTDMVIEFKNYVKSLFEDVSKMFEGCKVNLTLKIEPSFIVDIDTAIPLGLILNELIVNSYKYAKNDDGKTNIRVSLEEGSPFNILIVGDNGDGIPDNVDLNKIESIGLKLVRSLAKQLHGKMDYRYNNGAEFRIYFKKTTVRELVD